jgi:hypothetical protein
MVIMSKKKNATKFVIGGGNLTEAEEAKLYRKYMANIIRVELGPAASPSHERAIKMRMVNGKVLFEGPRAAMEGFAERAKQTFDEVRYPIA